MAHLYGSLRLFQTQRKWSELNTSSGDRQLGAAMRLWFLGSAKPLTLCLIKFPFFKLYINTKQIIYSKQIQIWAHDSFRFSYKQKGSQGIWMRLDVGEGGGQFLKSWKKLEIFAWGEKTQSVFKTISVQHCLIICVVLLYACSLHRCLWKLKIQIHTWIYWAWTGTHTHTWHEYTVHKKLTGQISGGFAANLL